MSSLYVATRAIFYLEKGEKIREIYREKRIDGNSGVETIGRGLKNIQFPIPTSILLNEAYFLEAKS